MKTYRFSLNNVAAIKCCFCGKRTLKRYWDSELKEFLPNYVGRCNREVNCGYHLTPREYFANNNIKSKPSNYVYNHPLPPKPKVTYIDSGIMEQTLRRTYQNNFIRYLSSLFKDDVTEKLIRKFKIATSTHWNGATLFWQIDEEMRVRAGKVMLFKEQNGKRVKEPFNHVTWVHILGKWKGFNMEQCFFGLHQIKDDLNSTIAIVESEKTAILMTAMCPKLIWLASGGMGLSIQKFIPLEDRRIIFFPDAGIDKNKKGSPYQQWLCKAETFKLLGYNISVSSSVEEKATDEQRRQGYDLADYLIKTDQSGLAITEGGYPAFWDL